MEKLHTRVLLNCIENIYFLKKKKKKQTKTFSYKFGNDHFGAKILSYGKNWMFTHLLIPLPCRPFFPGDQHT
jgi:hypothetical protein